MRRQGGHYGGESGGGGGGYGSGGSQSHQNSKSGYYQGRHEEQQQQQQQSGDKEGAQHNNQWRWERDGPEAKLPQASMSPTAPFSEGQGRDAPRSYYQNQRMDPRMPVERQGGGDPRSQSHEEDMDIGYEDNRMPPTLEGLEQRFVDDIMKLSKEQTDAEDAENARHRERINAINVKYEEQLFALRAKHVGWRDEFLRRESQARHQQYQQIVMDQYPASGAGGPSTDPRGANAGSGGESHRSYNSDSYDSYRERGPRYPANARDHGYEAKAPYPRGRAYESASRYY
ncbi:ATP-dependent DNA/RNA helicase DHX36-like [Salvia splendens]|uniref:ATP-dependent DNA/RNA helicase DHX36-like n=1 Tax=Salvia splendens TaxID=180675 RepID=UPI001C25D975|nr:ATP-dependent DNA/RNA helicase DHX36-like [Salvia splendens]